MIGLKHKIQAYIIQTFGAGILSLLFIKILYSLGIADGLCWTTDCEIESIGVIFIFYSIIAIINLYLIILPLRNKFPSYLAILILTLIIQIYSSTKGSNFIVATIFYGLAAILNYQIIVKNIKINLSVTLLGGFIMLLIIGLNYLNLIDILIARLGAQFNPDNEELIKWAINILTIGLLFQIIGFTIYKMKNKHSM